MERYVCPESIYKYTSLGGLIKTLEKRSFKLSRPSDFNDPIDMYIQEPLNLDTEDFLEQMKHSLLDYLKDSNDNFLLNNTKSAHMIGVARSAWAQSSAEKREIMEHEILNRPIKELYDIEKLNVNNKEMVDFLTEIMSHHAVFCSTLDQNNLLMWAHYSDQHRGAVIEYTPSIEKDSALLASKPVIYSEKRPLLYQNAKEMMMRYLAESPEQSAGKMLDRIIYSKSIEWSYEKEYRLVIPDFIRRHEEFGLLSFYAEELSAIYFGCRMSNENKEMAARMAISINNDVKLYVASVHPREYSLDFIPFSLK
jgi:hypothetical protein